MANKSRLTANLVSSVGVSTILDFNTDRLNVSGVSTFTGNIDANGDLDVDGHTELDNLNVSGVSTFAGTADFNVDVDIDGRTELDITNISETLNVVGISTFASNVDINADIDVDGHAELDNLNVSGVSTFASNVDINADIDVDGHTELDNLNVSGVTTAQSLLVVGSGTTTGTADQPLQVFGKGYFSNRVGINTTDPTSLLNVVGGEVHIKSGGVSQVPLRIKRSSSGGRAQFTIEDENDNPIWRLGGTGVGGTYFAFYHQLQNNGSGKTYGGFGSSDVNIPKDYFSLEVNQYVTVGSNADSNDGIHLRNDGGTSLDTGNAINFYGSNDFTGNIVSQINSSRSTYNHGSIGLLALNNNGTPSSSISLNSSNGPISDYNGNIFFRTGDGTVELRSKIDSNGTLYVGGNFSGSVSSGGAFYISGVSTEVYAARHAGTVMFINRNFNDGELIQFRRNNSSVGNITVSSGTVTLTGGHLSRWTQLPGNGERVGILTGTVMSNIDEMCEWIDPEVPDTYWTEYDDLPKGVSVGDIKNPGTPGGKQQNIQLNRMKISDVEGDPNVAGVFQSWDDDDDYFLNDIHCAMTGDFVIRVGAGVTVQRGDLLMSAGDGTAKPQEDDIIRSKTIAKVTSVHTSMVFDDGSYCVPCVLMAC